MDCRCSGARPNYDNAFFAFGNWHFGMTAGPVMGKVIAEIVAGRSVRASMWRRSIPRGSRNRAHHESVFGAVLLLALACGAAGETIPCGRCASSRLFRPARASTSSRARSRIVDRAWNQPVVVDNRPGAGGTIAGELVAKGNADGYTLMLGNVSTLAIAKALYPRLAYDPLRDFAPITLITTSENVMVVHPSVPVTSVK